MSTNLISAISDRLVLAVYTDYSYHRDSCDFLGHPFQGYLSSRRHIMCGIPPHEKRKILSTIINSLSWQTLMHLLVCVTIHLFSWIFHDYGCGQMFYWYFALRIWIVKILFFLLGQSQNNPSVLPFWKIRTMPDNINTMVLFWFRAVVLNLWLEDHRSNTIFEGSPLYRLDFLDLI